MKNFDVKIAPAIQREGEYVLTREGSKDFGEITWEISHIIKRQAGKIRLRVGIHKGKHGDYGEKHIERTERLQQIIKNGYNNARDFIQDITCSFDAIYKGERSRLILSKCSKITNTLIFIELTPADDGDFYDVKTGFVSRKNYFKNKTLLWQKPKAALKS